jgi:hypothetical protein
MFVQDGFLCLIVTKHKLTVRCTFTAGIQNNFQDHRLFDQLLESQADIGKPEQAFGKGLL